MTKATAFVTLLNKTARDAAISINGTAPLTAVENNLASWFIRLEINNSGISKTNSGTLTLRVDDLGTFIRSGPILVDQNTKNTYLIEMQIKQDLDNDGDFSEPEEQGQKLRAIIGQPQISIDESYGEVLKINLVGIEYALKEGLTSREHKFQSLDQSFINRLIEANNNATGIRISNPTNVNLPTSPKLTFKPFNPTKIHDTLTEIIDVAALPQVAGGSFTDYYFDFAPNTSFTNWIDVTADVFGGVDSGVTLDPLSLDVADTNEEQTVVTDNIEYKNHVIMVGSSDGGSLPMERTRFASKWEHAKIRDEWAQSTVYTVNDLVKVTTTTTYKPHLITYYKCKVNHTSTTTKPYQDGTKWEIDFSDVPEFINGAFYRQGEFITTFVSGQRRYYQAKVSATITVSPPVGGDGNWELVLTLPSGFTYEDFVSYTPWTSNVDLWKQLLGGSTFDKTSASVQLGGGTVAGWIFDWNITKANYNRKDLTNHYETITPKWVTTSEYGDPATLYNRAEYDGNRFLIRHSGSGDWSGQTGKIAEFDGTDWVFSEPPQNGDIVNSIDEARVRKYNGTTWTVMWNPVSPSNTDKPSPFHLCHNVGLVAGATGIAGQAVQFTYRWEVNNLDLANTHFNRTSRGAWICASFPLPRRDTTNYPTGKLYGGDGVSAPFLGHLNTNNMDYNRKGKLGWNQGIDVEDMGKITAIKFKLKVGLFKDVQGTSTVEGHSDIPLTFWCIDKFDRVWYSKFKVRRNNQWDDVRIGVGDMSSNQLYFARWDELAKINDVTLTFLDFTLSEKEFTGVQFDWKYVKHWGIQLDESYGDTGLYKNGVERAYEYGEDASAELQAEWWKHFVNPFIGLAVDIIVPEHTPVTQNYIRMSAKITLDDLHFVKELIVTSDDDIKTEPRTTVEFLPTEDDYENLKVRAIGMEARKRFFPQFWHVRATGDVRLKFGKLFTIAGTRVPNGTQQMIVSEVKHVYGHDGYHVEVAGLRKFTTSG